MLEIVSLSVSVSVVSIVCLVKQMKSIRLEIGQRTIVSVSVVQTYLINPTPYK